MTNKTKPFDAIQGSSPESCGIGGGVLSPKHCKMLSAESQNLLHRFQTLPLKEKKIVFMLAGEIIAENDKNLDLNALPDEDLDVKFCQPEDDQQATAEKLDLALFERLENIVAGARDSSSTTSQLLQFCETQEQTIKKLKIENSNARTFTSAYSTPTSASTNNANANTVQSSSSSLSTNWMNFRRSSVSTSSTPRKPENANKNNGIEFVSSSYFASASQATAPTTAYTNGRYNDAGSTSTAYPQALAQTPAQTPTAKLLEGQAPKPYSPLTQSPYTLPSLEFFLAKQSRTVPKRRGKSGTFTELCNKSKNELITSYLTSEFKAPPKPKFVKPNPSELEEFNDMFMEEAKPEEADAGPSTGAGGN